MAEHQSQFRLQSMCRVLRVQRSGYYAWKKKPKSKRTLADESLLVKIKHSFESSQSIYGSPRVYCDLREDGVLCGEKRIARLMRQAQLARYVGKHAVNPTYHAQWNLHYKRCRPFTRRHSMKNLFVFVTLLFASLAQGQTLKDFTLGEKMKRAKASDLCPAGFTAFKLNLMEDDSMKGYSMQACTKRDPGTIANLVAKYVHLNYMESRLESVSYELTTRQDADRLLEALKAKYGLAIKNNYPGCDYWELSSGARLSWCPHGSVNLDSKKWVNAMANYKPTIKKQSEDL